MVKINQIKWLDMSHYRLRPWSVTSFTPVWAEAPTCLCRSCLSATRVILNFLSGIQVVAPNFPWYAPIAYWGRVSKFAYEWGAKTSWEERNLDSDPFVFQGPILESVSDALGLCELKVVSNKERQSPPKEKPPWRRSLTSHLKIPKSKLVPSNRNTMRITHAIVIFWLPHLKK